MKTPWGEQLDHGCPLPDYPRPQMVRDGFVNLNGLWSYAITDSADVPAAFEGQILVPFSPESELSGVSRALTPTQFLWYRRTFVLPACDTLGPDAHTILHFGAVDQCATVFVNGARVGGHTGGYLPFCCEITDALLPQGKENVLTVCVTDMSDTGSFSRGKQKTARGGMWYTPQSGIWQTVWLEQVPAQFIRRLVITPRFDDACVELTVVSDADMPCEVTVEGIAHAGSTNLAITVMLPGFIAWSPENPRLYSFAVRMGNDAVTSYFAMRKFSVGSDAAGRPALCLNNEPYFQLGVLDQGYWPDGLYTAPSDEAMVYDIQLMKQMGFNMLRKHIKIEPLRWYYHCDRLGMLVWQDMVNGGGAYRPWTISAPLVLHNAHSDHDYAYFSREDAAGRAQYISELTDTVTLLYNCPCVAMWVPFNEGWGQFDALDAVQRIRALDQTRPIDHASGWHDQGGGDIKSLHVYFYPYRYRPDRLGRPVALTEFGGYGHRVQGHCFGKNVYGYKMLQTPEKLLKAYEKLILRQILPARAKGLAASVYTQLSDVEDETNGFVTYDRRVVKLPIDVLYKLHARLR